MKLKENGYDDEPNKIYEFKLIPYKSGSGFTEVVEYYKPGENSDYTQTS